MSLLADREQNQRFRNLLDAGDEAGMRQMALDDPLFLAHTAESFYLRAAKELHVVDGAKLAQVFQFLDDIGHSAQLFGDDAVMTTFVHHQPEAWTWLLDHGAIMRGSCVAEWMCATLRGEGVFDIAQSWQWRPAAGLNEWPYTVLAAGALLGTPAETLDVLAAAMSEKMDPDAVWQGTYRWLNFYAAEKREGHTPHLAPTQSSTQWLLSHLGRPGIDKLKREMDDDSLADVQALFSTMDHVVLEASAPAAQVHAPRRGL